MARAQCCSPFRSRDYRLLYAINCIEFLASTLSRLSALQWLYEATGTAMALGGLGVVTLLCQVPSIALGGVLADEMRRTSLVSAVQAAAACVAALRWLLCATGSLAVWHIYMSVGLLEVCKHLEGSARASITAAVVATDVLPHAITQNVITQNLGEVIAPFVFWSLADIGGGGTEPAGAGDTARGSLVTAFGVAALAYVPCALLPRLIRADTRPEAQPEKPEGADGSCTAAAVATAAASRMRAMGEGVRYITRHPLLRAAGGARRMRRKRSLAVPWKRRRRRSARALRVA